MQQLVIPQLGFPQVHEQLMLGAARHLGGLEGDINQILADGAGQHPLEEGKILVPLVFRHNTGALAELRNDLLVVIDKAAIDFRNIAAISAQMAANLADFLVVHGITSFLYEMPSYYSTGVRKNPEENRRGRSPSHGFICPPGAYRLADAPKELRDKNSKASRLLPGLSLCQYECR